MKQEKKEKQPAGFTAAGKEEEEKLDINELMDVQGGLESEPLRNCGLGCYLSGIDDTRHGSETSEQDDKS